MSRTDEIGLPSEGQDARDRAPSAFDRIVEVSSRMGVSREAARSEMERFRGVAEYETRKIFGQHSALRQPAEPLPARKKRGRRSSQNGASTNEVPQVKAEHRPRPESSPSDAQQRENTVEKA